MLNVIGQVLVILGFLILLWVAGVVIFVPRWEKHEADKYDDKSWQTDPKDIEEDLKKAWGLYDGE